MDMAVVSKYIYTLFMDQDRASELYTMRYTADIRNADVAIHRSLQMYIKFIFQFRFVFADGFCVKNINNLPELVD